MPNKPATLRKMREYSRQKRAEVRESIHSMLGLKCARCGFDDPRALQIDHVNGGGRQEQVQNRLGGLSRGKLILGKILAGSKEYQLLCANCNWIKRAENAHEQPNGNRHG